MDRSQRLPTSRKRLLSALPRPHVRLSTGRLVSHHVGNESCAGLAGASLMQRRRVAGN
jgi:hypothetical protein